MVEAAESRFLIICADRGFIIFITLQLYSHSALEKFQHQPGTVCESS